MATKKSRTGGKTRRELTDDERAQRTARLFRRQAQQERHIRKLAKQVIREREKTDAALTEFAAWANARTAGKSAPVSEQV